MGKSAEILSTDDLAARWGIARSTISERWRKGLMPAPFNAELTTRGFRWHLDTILAYEHGDWSPTREPVRFGLVAS